VSGGPPNRVGSTEGPPRAPIDDRIAARRREVRRDRQVTRRRRTFTVVGLLALLGLLVVIESSPLVGLEDVVVVGTDRLTEDEVRQAAGLELGTSTLRLRLGQVEERVAALPLVGTVEARRADPLSVTIAVGEREPALLAAGDGEEVLLDRTGTAIAPADGSVPVPDGLVTVALPDAPPALGRTGAESSPVVAAVRTWRNLSGPLRSSVARLVVDDAREVTLDLDSGVEVRFGRAERFDEKVRALGVVLEDVGDTRISAIDVRAPTRPVAIP
jgi:cell division protein FtsQ